jgi:Tripartite tricarboxylate transporter family receptor
MKIVRVVLSLLLLATFAGVAGAEGWPTRMLRIVVPFPAGGSGDVQVRIVADELAKVLGQPVIVENKPGASGGLAAVEVAHAPPDGYTLMVGSVGTHAINVSLYSKLQYDPVKDFAPLTLVTVFPQLIVPGINFKATRWPISSHRSRRTLARRAMVHPESARRRILPASCSGLKLARISFTCHTVDRGRRPTICSADSCS